MLLIGEHDEVVSGWSSKEENSVKSCFFSNLVN